MTESEILKKLESVLAINEKLMKENLDQKKMIESLSGGSSRNVEMGCNAVYGVTLLSPGGDIEIDMKYGETLALPVEDVRNLLKRNSTRKLFTSGIVYFVDETEYDNFSIRRKCNINTETIVKMYKGKSTKNLVEFFDKATSKKLDFDVMNILFYKIVGMECSGELGEINHALRVATEEYFGMNLDMAKRLYTRVKSFL